MSAASYPLSSMLQDLALELEDSHARLAGTLHEVASCSELVSLLKFSLESEQAKLLATGLEGSNKEQRDACLRLKLQDQYAALHEAEHNLQQARLEHDLARLEWDALRYRLRAYEAAACSE